MPLDFFFIHFVKKMHLFTSLYCIFTALIMNMF